MITAAFVTFLAAAALANLGGYSHSYGGLLACAAWFFLCRSLGPRGWRWLLAAALWFSVAVSVLAVVQFALWLPRARGPFISPNFLGAYAVLMFFLAAQGWFPSPAREGWAPRRRAPLPNQQLIEMGVRAASLISLALSQSRGAILALGAGLGVLALSRGGAFKRLLLLTIVAIAIGYAVLLIRPGTTNPRTDLWLLGLRAGLQRPLTGWGIDGLMIAGLNRFYSVPLEWFINAGVLGVLAGGWLLAASAWAARRETELLAFLAAWFVQGLFLDGTLATSWLLVTIMAYLASEHRDVTHGAGRVDDDHPALDRGARAGRADR